MVDEKGIVNVCISNVLSKIKIFISKSRKLLNDNHWEKLCFIQFSTRMAGWLAASDPLRVKMFEKCDSLNRQ